MTPEQMDYFMDAIWDLLECVYVGRVIDGKLVKLRDAEFRSAMMFLACALPDNGYVNMTHEEGRFVCQTESKDTVRAHLWRLALIGVLKDKCLNGTTRVKFSRFPGRELVTNRDAIDLAEVLTASTEVLTASTEVLTASTEVLTASTEVLTASTEVLTDDPEIAAARAVYQQFRAVCQQFRAVRQHPSRNFDGFAQNQPSKLVSKLDLNTPPKLGANELTATPSTTIDPVEEALSVTFLLAAGFWPKTAKQLAKIHRFELLRRTVAFWWCNRRSVGGEFAEKPGIVITWLTNPDEVVIPELPREFLASDLYQRHRTPDEVTADVDAACDTDTADNTSDGDNTSDIGSLPMEWWKHAQRRLENVLPMSTFNTWVRDSYCAAYDDVAQKMTIGTHNQHTKDFLETRLRVAIKRELAAVVGHRIDVDFATVAEMRRR